MLPTSWLKLVRFLPLVAPDMSFDLSAAKRQGSVPESRPQGPAGQAGQPRRAASVGAAAGRRRGLLDVTRIGQPITDETRHAAA